MYLRWRDPQRPQLWPEKTHILMTFFVFALLTSNDWMTVSVSNELELRYFLLLTACSSNLLQGRVRDLVLIVRHFRINNETFGQLGHTGSDHSDWQTANIGPTIRRWLVGFRSQTVMQGGNRNLNFNHSPLCLRHAVSRYIDPKSFIFLTNICSTC